MGLWHGAMTGGTCRNGCPLLTKEGGDDTLDGDIFKRGTEVITDGGEDEDRDDADDDVDDDNDNEDKDDGDLVVQTGGESGEKRTDDEGDEDDDDEDGEDRDLLVDRSTGSVCVWKRSDENVSGE